MTIGVDDFAIQHHFCGGVYMRQMKLAARHYVMAHAHNFDHFGLLAQGCAEVELDGAITVYNGPCAVPIVAGRKHKITARTDLDWFCISRTDVTDATLIDEITLLKE